MTDNITAIEYYIDRSVDEIREVVDLDDEQSQKEFAKNEGTLIYSVSETNDAYGIKESISIYIIDKEDKVLVKAIESRRTYTPFGLDEDYFYSYASLSRREYNRLYDLISQITIK